MKNNFFGLALVLVFALPGTAAERLKIKPGPEDLAYLEKNRGASLLAWAHPIYPPEPGADWRERAVRVAFEVDTEGRVVDARVLSGSEQFRAVAVAAVSGWKFRPEIVDGQPAVASKAVRLVFTPAGTPKKTARDDMWPPYRIEEVEVSPPGDPANTDALYPRFLVDRRLAGEVELLLGINTDGRVDGVKVVRASHPDFLSGALQTVAGWEMRPARQGRVPVEGQKQAVLIFYPVDENAQVVRVDWLERNGILLRDPPGTKPGEYFDRMPEAVAMVDPVYPHNLAQTGTRGSARVNFSVNHQGRVEDVSVEEATAPEFGQAVAAAIAAWQFEPLRRKGEACRVDFSITWQFQEPRPDSAEQRLMNNLGTEQQAVSARQLDQPLFPLFTRQPVYPASQLDAREAGGAEIEVTIDCDGRVRLPNIRKATQPEFGWAAATAVSQWLFATPRKAGRPVAVQVIIPIQFQAPTAPLKAE